ncbi:peroxiredoxin [Erythrobacter alti]|uniref:peroxiredoxin n=1 Tax=Erythrobacter alti TaxID=1896145 RepID=UPI0030F4AB9B
MDPNGTSISPLRIGDTPPDFEARSTVGPVRFSSYRGRWLILLSHPADFTPVCTTEFVELARQEPEFAKRDCALMALSVDSLFSHYAWLRLIKSRFDVEVRFPIIEDPTLVIGRAFGMVAPKDNDSATVRTTFFIDPAGTVRATTCYPSNVGRSIPEMLRMLDALQAIDEKGGLAPANWTPGSPLMQIPENDLDAVFGAADDTGWFLKDLSEGRGS